MVGCGERARLILLVPFFIGTDAQHIPLDEEAHDLLGKERIALCLLSDAPAPRATRPLPAAS
jgi:hypothetical protein